MIDDPLDEQTTLDHAAAAPPPRHDNDLDPHDDALLVDVAIQVRAIRKHWRAWNVDERHDALNELHCRWEEADRALMDAVRRTDFQADQPTTVAAS